MPGASPQGKAHSVFRVYFKTSQGQFHEFLMQHCPKTHIKTETRIFAQKSSLAPNTRDFVATNLRQGRILKTDTTKEDAEISDSSRNGKLYRRHSAISHFVIFRKHCRSRLSDRHAGSQHNRMFHHRSDFGNCRAKRSCKSRSKTVSDSRTMRRFHHILHIHERSVPHGPRRTHRHVSRIHNSKHCRRIHTALCRTCRSKAIMSISTKRMQAGNPTVFIICQNTYRCIRKAAWQNKANGIPYEKSRLPHERKRPAKNPKGIRNISRPYPTKKNIFFMR